MTVMPRRWRISDSRLVRERPSDRDALALAAGELGRLVIGPVGETDLLEQAQRALSALAAVHAGADQRHLDVGLGREVDQQMVLLKDEPDQFAPMARRARLTPDLAAVDQDSPAGRLFEPADQVQQRAFAGA